MKYVLLFVETEEFERDLEEMGPAERERAFQQVMEWMATNSDKITGGNKLQSAAWKIPGLTATRRSCRRSSPPFDDTEQYQPKVPDVGIRYCQKPEFTGPFKIRASAMTCGLLPHVKPGDGPSDDHALDLRRTLEIREARGGAGSFRR